MTMQCRLRPWFVVPIVCGVLVGCSGAQWSNQRVAARYQPAKKLSVMVLTSSGRDDLKEAVETFTSTLRDELKSKGIDANFAATTTGGPGAELKVIEWDPGSRALRYLVGFGSGEGHMTIAVSVTDADGSSSLEGEVRGYVNGGWFGGDALDAPREAARSIADAIATGKVAD